MLLGHVTAGELGDDAAASHHEDPVGEAQDLLDIRGDDDDGCPGCRLFQQQVVDRSTRSDPEALAAELRAAFPAAPDVVLDPICGPATTAALQALGDRGRLVQLGSAAAPTATLDSATVRSKTPSILGYTNAALTPAQTADALTAVFRHAAAGRITAAYEPFPLTQVSDAWDRHSAGTDGRRVVVVPRS